MIQFSTSASLKPESKDSTFATMEAVDTANSENLCCTIQSYNSCSKFLLPTSLPFRSDQAFGLSFAIYLSSCSSLFYFRIWLGSILSVVFEKCLAVALTLLHLCEKSRISILFFLLVLQHDPFSAFFRLRRKVVLNVQVVGNHDL